MDKYSVSTKELTYTIVAKEDFFCPNLKQTYYAKANLLDQSTPVTAFIPSYATDSPGIKSLQFLPSLFIFFSGIPQRGSCVVEGRTVYYTFHFLAQQLHFWLPEQRFPNQGNEKKFIGKSHYVLSIKNNNLS